MAHLPLWTPVASVLLALAWLLPNAAPPWLAFHKDAWAALVFLLVGVGLLFMRRPVQVKPAIDPLVAVLLIAAGLPWLQWVLGTIGFSGHAWMGSGYFAAAALVLLLGHLWEQQEPGRPGDFLFLACWLAAMVTSGLMLAQWLRLDVDPAWVNPVPAWGRPFGNLIQPNNAGSLLLLGMVAVLWFMAQGRMRPWVALVGTVYFTFFLALTGSRIGYLSFLVLTLLGLWLGRHRPLYRVFRPALVVALATFPIFLFIVTNNWGSDTGLTAGVQPFDTSSTNIRLQVYRAYLETSLTQPWLGFGFEQGAKTQLAAYSLGYELPGLFTWSHNAFLDLITWFGWPFALLAIAAVAGCAVVLLRSPFDARRSVYFAGVYVLFMHGMVELPLAFAYFLLPACLLVGAMTVGLPWPRVAVPLAFPRALVLGLAGLLGVITYDYLRVESAFYTWRFINANIGRNHPMDVPDTWLLNQQEALLRGLRAEPGGITSEDLNRFKQAIYLDPSAAGIQHLAQLQLKQGDIAAAQRTADMGYILTQGKQRRALAARWRYLGTTDAAYRAVSWRGD